MFIKFLWIIAISTIAVYGHPIAEAIPASTVQYWFSQRIDHFANNNGTWQQQYLVNATFYKAGGPIYVSTPGELPVSSRYVDNVHVTSLAQKTNGLLVTIEHRFFGSSNPMPDLSGPSLQSLTIENVLEDFASFVRTAKLSPAKVFPVPVSPNASVVFFGGSYSGNIAAWMRAKYPKLVAGAWASSAISYSRLEYYQLDQGFGRHLRALGCAEEFSQAIDAVDEILISGNKARIATLQQELGVPSLTPQDTAGLLSGLGITFSLSPVSTTEDLVEKHVCSFFNSTNQEPIAAYAAVIKNAIKQTRMTQESLIKMGDTSYGIDDYSLGQVNRVWYYMGCKWFGNWQVAPPPVTRLPRYRSRLVNLSYFEPNCQAKFGKGVATPVDVAAYNRKWFTIINGVSNIYFTSGSLDIWHESTVLSAAGLLLKRLNNSSAFVINGATHVQDLNIDQPSDLASVRISRAIGDALVSKWI
ncbi:peptidase S28 [Coemansia reversa NRRL 1564]|uniref:Peptidase S28 n=1 Tax=Coemansia reversa (strain ATCC 12441 / NRRL 1564) TaxID=763665 RepID=A0A2G5BJ67_COERN|nr:peptidase S28 [Coemansia reversa NRRL 1564]|eukprot:PIA19055.1 peptidase S28 [Coemansia reversa NRRL 1564]